MKIVLDNIDKVQRWDMLMNDRHEIGDIVDLREGDCPICYATLDRNDRHDRRRDRWDCERMRRLS